MTKIGIKRTFNLHKYSTQLREIISEWKTIITFSVAILGLVCGTLYGKGEGELYKTISETLFLKIFNSESAESYISLITNLLYPTIFFIISFFCGLSAYGVFISNFVPFSYSMLIGMVTYFLYSEYKLKGLAFFVINVLPFAALSLMGILLVTAESINMSQTVLSVLSNKNKRSAYNFTFYYKNSIKCYAFVVLSAIVKTVLDRLFIGLISF